MWPLSSRGGGKALVAGPLRKELFFAAFPKTVPTYTPDGLGLQPLLKKIFRKITKTKQLIIWYLGTVKCICGLFKINNFLGQNR